MSKRLLFIAPLLVPVLLMAQAPSETQPPPFVTAEQLNGAAILPAPAANDSWKTLEELAELHRLEATRTPEQIAHAQADDREESIFAFGDVMGNTFTRAALPKTALLSDHIKRNEGVLVNPTKKFFHRPRPYHLDATLHPVCKTTDNRADFGYPSGHGTTGYLEALVLMQMVPEKREAILARADDYAHSREVCGAHFASDEAASKALAYAAIGLMMNNARFKTELEAATAELRNVLQLAPVMSAQK